MKRLIITVSVFFLMTIIFITGCNRPSKVKTHDLCFDCPDSCAMKVSGGMAKHRGGFVYNKIDCDCNDTVITKQGSLVIDTSAIEFINNTK